jgi:hypothetical protein
MFEIGQTVLVITDKGVTYDGTIAGRAKGDDGGPAAYQIAVHGREQLGQWHKACDVFVVEPTEQEDQDSIQSFMKK